VAAERERAAENNTKHGVMYALGELFAAVAVDEMISRLMMSLYSLKVLNGSVRLVEIARAVGSVNQERSVGLMELVGMVVSIGSVGVSP
jgi:hypothetical protein